MSRLTIHSIPAPFADVETQTSPFPSAAHLSLRLKTFRYLMRHHSGLAPQAKVVDLGTGAGNFARVAARLGFKVTGVDARTSWSLGDALASKRNEHAQALVPPSRQEFEHIQCDLREFTDLASYDLVLAIGVIYHLPLNDQLALFRRCVGRPLLIDTELYAADKVPEPRKDRFRSMVTDAGYEGALCAETGDLWSSNGDTHSFWFTHESLLRALADCGHTRATMIDIPYYSAFGPRRWYLLHA